MGVMVVYLDVVFLVNFTLDFIILRLCGAALGRRAAYPPLLAASFFGGLYGCIIATGIIPMPAATLTTFIGVPYIFSKMCFPGLSIRGRCRSMLSIVLTAVLVGGLCTAVYEHSGLGYVLRTYANACWFLMPLLLLSVILVSLGIRSINNDRSCRKLMYSVEMVILGEKIHARALADTGNVLVDGILRRPVHVVDKRLLAPVLGKMLEDGELAVKASLHHIPYSTVGRAEGSMVVLKCDYLSAVPCARGVGTRAAWYEEGALIGLSDTCLSGSRAFDMLLNGEIILGNGD
jgi:stage II sporulation protein GA (sporulation sigma-E factor processing peptidase)